MPRQRQRSKLWSITSVRYIFSFIFRTTTHHPLEIGTISQIIATQNGILGQRGQEKEELKSRVSELHSDVAQKEGDSHEVFSEMTRQYRNMEAELMMRINVLEDENLQLQEQLEIMYLVQEETKRAKDRQLADRDVVIADQNRKMQLIVGECAHLMKV